jgi:hypothetical protein
MIAMTWLIDVPLFTSMEPIRETAESTAQSLSESAGLLAGVTAISQAGVEGETRNSIAMLTIWANTSRMAEFLWGDATARVERQLARPSARIWTVSTVKVERTRFPNVTHAGVHIRPRISHDLIASVVANQRVAAGHAAAGRSTGLTCRGLDPNSWEDVSVDAWVGRPRSYDGRVLQIVRAVAGERL